MDDEEKKKAEEEAQKKADDADVSRFFRGKVKDVKAYLDSISDTIQEALDDVNTFDEILSALTE